MKYKLREKKFTFPFPLFAHLFYTYRILMIVWPWNRVVRYICHKVERSIGQHTFVKDFKMSGLPSLSEKLENFLTLLVFCLHCASFSPSVSKYTSWNHIWGNLVDPLRSYKHWYLFHWQQSDDHKVELLKPQIVNVLQDIVEIIIQDVMVDGHS